MRKLFWAVLIIGLILLQCAVVLSTILLYEHLQELDNPEGEKWPAPGALRLAILEGEPNEEERCTNTSALSRRYSARSPDKGREDPRTAAGC